MKITNRLEYNEIQQEAIRTRDVSLLYELPGIALDQKFNPYQCKHCLSDFDSVSQAERHEWDCYSYPKGFDRVKPID